MPKLMLRSINVWSVSDRLNNGNKTSNPVDVLAMSRDSLVFYSSAIRLNEFHIPAQLITHDRQNEKQKKETKH